MGELLARVKQVEESLAQAETARKEAQEEKSKLADELKRKNTENEYLASQLKGLKDLPNTTEMYRSKSWDVKTKVTHIYTPHGQPGEKNAVGDSEESIEARSTGRTEEMVVA